MGYSNIATTYYNGSGASQTDNGFVLNPYIGFLPIDNLLVAVQGGLILTDTTVSGHQFVAGTTLSHNRNYGVVTGAIGTDVSYAIVLDRLVITPHAVPARPHCIAYDLRGLPNTSLALLRRLGLPVLVWTVRSREDMDKALRYGDNIVFEGFSPPSPGNT